MAIAWRRLLDGRESLARVRERARIMEGGRASEEVFWILWKVLWEERSKQTAIKRSEMRRGEGDRFWRAELER